MISGISKSQNENGLIILSASLTCTKYTSNCPCIFKQFNLEQTISRCVVYIQKKYFNSKQNNYVTIIHQATCVLVARYYPYSQNDTSVNEVVITQTLCGT